MKTRTILTLGALLLTAALGINARAGLLGDTVTASHYYPDSSSLYSSNSVLVTAGTGDTTAIAYGIYQMNAEDNAVYINFTFGSTSWNSASFNGFVLSDIDELVTGVTVSTNLSGWSNSRLSFTGSSISANWESLSFNNDSYFNFEINSTPSVPDSGSTIALLGGALLAAAALRRKFATN